MKIFYLIDLAYRAELFVGIIIQTNFILNIIRFFVSLTLLQRHPDFFVNASNFYKKLEKNLTKNT